MEYEPGDLYDVPPGHDGWTIDDEDCVMLERSGMRRWFGGRRITTTGDGVLATFDAAAAAVRCSMVIRDAAAAQRLAVRLGVHVGEVELAGDDVRGMAVHEAARVMATAGRDEILVTEAVRLLCKDTDLVFEDAGEHDLKGVPDRLHLYRAQGAQT